MDIKKVENLLKLMRKYKVNEISIEDKEDGDKIHLVTMPESIPMGMPHYGHMPAMAPMEPMMMGSMDTEMGAPTPQAAPAAGKGGANLKPNQFLVRSQLVGTFYASPSPDAEPFVKVGQKVKKGDPLCIVEAMKLMNEIEADRDGTIVEILVNNSQPVEFDQPIFVME